MPRSARTTRRWPRCFAGMTSASIPVSCCVQASTRCAGTHDFESWYTASVWHSKRAEALWEHVARALSLHRQGVDELIQFDAIQIRDCPERHVTARPVTYLEATHRARV